MPHRRLASRAARRCGLATSWRAPRLREATREANGRLVLWDDPIDPVPGNGGSALSWPSPRPIRRSTCGTTGPRAVHARALARPIRHRRAGRDARWPVVAAAAHVPLALPAVVATGTIALEALAFATPARHRHVDSSAVGGHRRRRHARLRRRSGKCGRDGDALGADHRRAAVDRARRPATRRGRPRPGRRMRPRSLVRSAGRHLRHGCSRTSPTSRPLPCRDRSHEPKPASES